MFLPCTGCGQHDKVKETADSPVAVPFYQVNLEEDFWLPRIKQHAAVLQPARTVKKK